MNEPQCVEVMIEASSGGKIQIVKFNLQNDFGITYGEKYTIPSGWDQNRIDRFVDDKSQAIRKKVDDLAQAEQDALLESSDWHG